MVDFVLRNLVVVVLSYLLTVAIVGGIAALVAPEGRRVRFFFMTSLVLGPAGIGFAAIAPPPPLPDVEQAWKLRCERCGAWQNVEWTAKAAQCWRCSEALR